MKPTDKQKQILRDAIRKAGELRFSKLASEKPRRQEEARPAVGGDQIEFTQDDMETAESLERKSAKE